MSFLEYQVEWEDTAEMRGFNTWPQAAAHIRANVTRRFRPFAITCVSYRGKQPPRTLWEIEWTDPALQATKADRRFLRQIGADCALEIFKWSYA
jgi:hypothetical protein